MATSRSGAEGRSGSHAQPDIQASSGRKSGANTVANTGANTAIQARSRRSGKLLRVNSASTVKKRRPPRDAKLSRVAKPDTLSLEDWQRELRRQFGSAQLFQLANIGEHPVFSEFLVTNPQSHNTYRVAIRGPLPGDNFCACPDFATNELGTCKHVEFTLAQLRKGPSTRTLLEAGYDPPYSEVFVQYGSQRAVRFRAGRDCPDDLKRLALKYFNVENELRDTAFEIFEKFLEQAEALQVDLRCYDDALSVIAGERDRRTRIARIDQAFPEGIRSPAFDSLLRVNLYDYQREGALFAARNGRCLIGDEMGLGKTIQALATAEILARQMGIERVLVICPTSLKYQWEREIQRFTERSVSVVSGLSPAREQIFASASFFKVLNYDTVHSDLELIRRWGPDLVILDEAQRIKNWNTRLARSVKQISSPYALVLTGTPLENRLEELISIVQFVDQQRLGPTYRLLHNHQQLDEHGKVVGYRNLDQIGETLRPILIRRQKRDMAEQLPPRLDQNIFVPMTELQRTLHSENYEQVAKIVSKWRKYGYLTESDQRRLMICLQNMRMSCDSSYLLDQGTDEGVKADEAVTLFDELCETSTNKIVVFSQWLRMHALLVKRIQDRPWDHVLFHGGIDSERRRELIDRFREDPQCRIFLATDAGGVGLNLQHANVVVNMDLPWNPAVLEQRIGRVHRLGQTQPVSVVNYIAQGTIEEGMLGVIQFKKNLFAGVLDGGEKNVFLGGSKLKKFMESVDKITGSIPSPVPEEATESLQVHELVRAHPSSPEQFPRPDAAQLPDGSQRSPDVTCSAPVAAATSLYAAPSASPSGDVDVATNPQAALASLLQQGITLLQQLAAQTNLPVDDERAPYQNRIRVDQDEYTGRPYLRVPLPDPDVLREAWQAVGKLLDGLK